MKMVDGPGVMVGSEVLLLLEMEASRRNGSKVLVALSAVAERRRKWSASLEISLDS